MGKGKRRGGMRERDGERSGLTGQGRGGPFLCLYRYLSSIHHLATSRYSPTASQIGLDRSRAERTPIRYHRPIHNALISGQTDGRSHGSLLHRSACLSVGCECPLAALGGSGRVLFGS